MTTTQSMNDLIYFASLILVGLGIYYLHKYLGKEREDDHKSIYDDHDELAPVLMIIIFVFWLILFIISLFSLEDSVIEFIKYIHK